MKAVVLLSEGVHPVSRRAMLPAVEARALRLALDVTAGLGATADAVTGLHAGASDAVVRDAFGHGLDRLVRLDLADGADPVAALAAHLRATAPDLILAGAARTGGEETGMVPHLVAAALDLPIVADVVAIAAGDRPGRLVIDQARPRGARRRITVDGPVVASVAESAPAARPFAHGRLRRGVIEVRPVAFAKDGTRGEIERATIERSTTEHPVPELSALEFPVPEHPAPEFPAIEERPHRARPRLIVRAEAAAGTRLVNPSAADAAEAILAHLRARGFLDPA